MSEEPSAPKDDSVEGAQSTDPETPVSPEGSDAGKGKPEPEGESGAGGEDSSPAAEDSSPAAEATPPAAEDSSPAAEDSSPAAEDSSPAAEDSSPAAEDSSPAAEATPPADAEPESNPAEAAEAAPAAARSTGEVLIEAEGLSKYYGDFTAIADVSFEVRRGEVVAFLGPNGAGKSTTMKILTGVSAPDKGEARIGGLSVIHNRIDVAKKLGYLPENGPLYLEMTPLELLRFFGEARGLSGPALSERVDTMIQKLDLKTVRNKPIEKLSKGFRQRVGLAQALLHEPDVMIMDEPTSGLDPNQIRDVRRIIRDLARDKAILLSTHILQEVVAIADRVVFISRGRIVFQGSVEDLYDAGKGNLEEAFAAHTT